MIKRLPVLIPRGKKVLLYDGVCNLCDGFVQFLLRRDKAGDYYYASLQSDIGRQLLAEHGLDADTLSTVVMIDGDRIYTHSDVGLKIARDLGGFYRLFYSLRHLPLSFRNRVYDWVARNRYRFFGKKETCMLPRPEWRSRFLDVL